MRISAFCCGLICLIFPLTPALAFQSPATEAQLVRQTQELFDAVAVGD
jgi:hypothetical protein